MSRGKRGHFFPRRCHWSSVFLCSLQGQWVPRRQHRTCRSLRSDRQGVPRLQHRSLGILSSLQGTLGARRHQKSSGSLSSLKGAVRPQATAQGLWVPEQWQTRCPEKISQVCGSVSNLHGAVRPKKTPRVLRIPEQYTWGILSLDDTTGTVGP